MTKYNLFICIWGKFHFSLASSIHYFTVSQLLHQIFALNCRCFLDSILELRNQVDIWVSSIILRISLITTGIFFNFCTSTKAKFATSDYKSNQQNVADDKPYPPGKCFDVFFGIWITIILNVFFVLESCSWFHFKNQKYQNWGNLCKFLHFFLLFSEIFFWVLVWPMALSNRNWWA